MDASTAILLAVGAAILLAVLLGLQHRSELIGGARPRSPPSRTAARTDSLTGLGNHRSFHDDLTAAMQARTERGATFALMAVDLDGLKRINDTKGHQAGDEYLRQTSECLRQAAASHGTVYRTGGDEFMVLLPDRRSWHALAVARTLDQLDAGGARAPRRQHRRHRVDRHRGASHTHPAGRHRPLRRQARHATNIIVYPANAKAEGRCGDAVATGDARRGPGACRRREGLGHEQPLRDRRGTRGRDRGAVGSARREARAPSPRRAPPRRRQDRRSRTRS